jgi:quercetin dioxygenase-like cupin family protein
MNGRTQPKEMTMRHTVPRVATLGAILIVVSGLSFAAGLVAQSTSNGPMFESAAGARLEVLFDGPSMGAPVDVGVLTFPPGTDSGNHPHGVTEIFYVLEGELEHVVNGESHLLTPGMLGHVSPPDLVNHRVDPNGESARAVVIWAPGGEAERISGNWTRVE